MLGTLEERLKEEFIRRYKRTFEVLTGIPFAEGTLEQKYNALIAVLREIIVSNWINTKDTYIKKKSRQVYYFSIEFLPGRLLDSYLVNLGIKEPVEQILEKLGIELSKIEDVERDIALGSGGLGRLASCFMDSMASCNIAGHGCGISYKYGLFQQKIVEGNQVELPDKWYSTYSVWQFPKKEKAVEVRFGGNIRMEQEDGHLNIIHTDYKSVLAVPSDMPIVGYKNGVVNTLRLWSAEIMPRTEDELIITNRQDYKKAIEHKYSVEALSEVLYPDDSDYTGKIFRLTQQYFMVSAGLQSILEYYKNKYQTPVTDFDDFIALHINDTHPALAIPELMRLLMDEERLGWDEAWRIVTNCVSYTNHTILPEAMEKWSVDIVRRLLPRVYQIIEEIDRRLRIQLANAFPNDWDKINNMAIIHHNQVFMANLAIHGSHSVNGVASIHTEILKKDVLRNFYDYCGYKFNNKTNGITHRRWLLGANPKLASLISSKIGDNWIKHPQDMNRLLPCLEDKTFLKELGKVKIENKEKLAKYILETTGIKVDTSSIFDVHIKRIHAYKRQFLNAIHIYYLYNLLKENPKLDIPKRTFIFAGKAAQTYSLAKATIKFINALAYKINNDKTIEDKIKVVFLENYSVSLAEIIIPAADISEQISTASKEASGTGNMKMMMNGAITLGTLDGANVEIREEVGDDNFVKFGLTADEVIELNYTGGYNAKETIENDSRLTKIVESVAQGEVDILPQELTAINNYVYLGNDEFYVFKDFDSYVKAQEKIAQCYKNRDKWLKMAGTNIAKSGKFSSDRTISEYAVGIWKTDTSEILE